MRRSIALLLPFAPLTACAAPGGGNNAQASAPAAGAPANAAGPASGSETAALARFRAEWLEACIGGARDAAPPGTPVERHCACAIDRQMTGKSLAQLEEEQASGAYRAPFQTEMRRCIREIPR